MFFYGYMREYIEIIYNQKGVNVNKRMRELEISYN